MSLFFLYVIIFTIKSQCDRTYVMVDLLKTPSGNSKISPQYLSFFYRIKISSTRPAEGGDELGGCGGGRARCVAASRAQPDQSTGAGPRALPPLSVPRREKVSREQEHGRCNGGAPWWRLDGCERVVPPPATTKPCRNRENCR